MKFQRLLLLTPLLLAAASGFAQTTDDLFDDGAVHQVHITMAATDWATLKQHYELNDYYNVTSFVWNGVGSNTATVNNVQVRSRGRGSRSPVKPGLHIDFNRTVTTQTFLGLSEIELKSNTQDASMLHERLSMKLFTRMGVPASREAPARVYVNGEYIGLYNIVESPDTQMIKRLFNDNMKVGNGFLYEYSPDWPLPANGQWHFEYIGSNLDAYANAAGNTPFNPQNPNANAPDTVTLEEFIRFINQGTDAQFSPSCDPTQGTCLTTYLEPKGWLTHVAVETYLADFDCILGDIFGLNNFFLYRFTNKKLSIFIAWDKDNAFSWEERPVLQNASLNVLMNRLLGIPLYRNTYFEALLKTSMMAGGDGGWLSQEATREYNQVKQAAYDDPNKQYMDSGILYPSTNAMFDSASTAAIGFGANRTRFVQQDVAAQGYTFPSTAPQIGNGGVINALAFASPPAGGLASIYGSNLGDAKSATVYVNGFVAPVVFGSAGQVNIQVPWEATGYAPFGVVINGSPSNIQYATVATYSPGIAVVCHTDGFTPVTDSSPAASGETLVVYATGLGPVNGPMVTGQLASTTSLQNTTQSATAAIGNQPATVSFAGLLPGFLGAYQVNVAVPASAPSGAQTFLTLTIGGQSSPPFRVPKQ